jgi:hypothetical protein
VWYCGLSGIRVIAVLELYLVSVCGTTDFGVLKFPLFLEIPHTLYLSMVGFRQNRTGRLHTRNVGHMFYTTLYSEKTQKFKNFSQYTMLCGGWGGGGFEGSRKS